ncbi:MAG: hypothetical protein IJ694_00145 [Acidaminococcaceae bacterium]|nr:hypothetical protein [Acidaminococcaceae bacterium]
MSEIKLFTIKKEVKELLSSPVLLEKQLQSLIEKNMMAFFGVKLLQSEYKIKDGRMDSIGIDENHCPVIFEYKRNINENVINQGLFYLDWLLDHKGDFKMLVIEKMGIEEADLIDWSYPCVICIANDFSRYDLHAVNQMARNIKLVKYYKYSDDLILFEHLNAPNVKPTPEDPDESKHYGLPKSHIEKLENLPDRIKGFYNTVCEYIEALGDDLEKNQLKYYLAYKKVQNMVCIEVYSDKVILRLKLNPDSVELVPGFTRDTREIGHYGTGDLEVTIQNSDDIEKAKPLLNRVYSEM